MLVATIQRLQYRHPQQTTDLLTGVNLTINLDSKIGLIGDNGCGKSTLFQLLSGALTADSGFIDFATNAHVSYLPQEIAITSQLSLKKYLWEHDKKLADLKGQIDRYDPDTAINSVGIFDEFFQVGGYLIEAKIKSQLTQFGFNENDLNRDLASFSGGEQTKIALCRLMLTEPQLLLLDEPSNHLDEVTLSWLENYLNQLSIPFIVISHDRRFLNNTVNEIVAIEQGYSTHYSGDFDFYKYQCELQRKQQLELHQQQKKKLKQLHEAAVQREQWSKIKQKQTRSVTKTGRICKRDDGSLPASKGKMTYQVAAIRTRMEQTIEKEKAKKPFIKKQRKLVVSQYDSVSNHYILNVNKLSKSYDNKILLSELNFNIEHGSRVAITGNNGCGKTSLLRILVGELNADAGIVSWPPQAQIAYYDQMALNIDINLTALENCARYNDDQTLIRTTLAQLFFPTPLFETPIQRLSHGERAKVALSQVLLQPANVIILDEPCNHLEISAREALEEALIHYPGTIIFVSHDRYFRQRLATEEICLSQ